MENVLSIFQCGFRKSYNTQECLIDLIEKWKSVIDKGRSFGPLTTDLFKAYDCLPHELLIVKLHGYGFGLAALRLDHSYLPNREQRTKLKALVPGKKSCLEYHKDLFKGLYSLILLYALFL